MSTKKTGFKIASKQMRVGLFGVGLDTYWPQFKGLRKRLVGYQEQIGEQIKALGVELVDAGLVDSPEKALLAQ